MPHEVDETITGPCNMCERRAVHPVKGLVYLGRNAPAPPHTSFTAKICCGHFIGLFGPTAPCVDPRLAPRKKV